MASRPLPEDREDGDLAGMTISSVIVQTRMPEPEHARLAARLSVLPGTTVYATGSAGKMVVVCETRDDAELTRRIDEIGRLPGVLGVHLVYHHAEPA